MSINIDNKDYFNGKYIYIASIYEMFIFTRLTYTMYVVFNAFTSNMELLEMLASRIARLRRKKWYSQETFAEISWFNRAYISPMEKWKLNLTLKSIEKIVNGLGIKPMELFDFEKNIQDINLGTHKTHDIIAKFSKKLVDIRYEFLLSQEELAKQSGISRAYMWNIERWETNTTIETIEQIADTLWLEMKDFFER